MINSLHAYAYYNKDPRMMFLGCPSHEGHFETATTLQRIQREAVGAKAEYNCTIESLRDSLRAPGIIKKTEKAILPDGTIYIM